MILIEKYNSNWPKLFDLEKERLQKHLQPWIVSIEHVGSTSIPSLSAKPIIDILIGVMSLDLVDLYVVPLMLGLGYRYIKEYEITIPNRRYLKLSSSVINYNIHIVNVHSEFYNRVTLFKNILLNNPTILLEYEKLKFKLSAQFDDEFEYSFAKSEFIDNILKRYVGSPDDESPKKAGC